MSTQQDIYAAGFENRPPMLNKDNYVPWSSRLLRYAKSDTDREVPITKTFHEQTDDELTDKEIKQMEADDQAIETILMGLPKDIYAAVDSCETAQEIWLRVQQMMKGLEIEKQTFPEKIASNVKFLNNLQPELRRHVTIVHQTKDLHEADYTQLYDFLKFNQVEVNELRAERLARTHDPLALMANSNNPYKCESNGNGNVVAVQAEGNGNGNKRNRTQLLISQKEEARITLQAEEYDLMADAWDIN
ncbi:hypothetical protein Tco_1171535 [Tanacetum coccineum]